MLSKKNRHIELWQKRIRDIESGKKVMNTAHLPAPYFGEKMTKERQLSFCRRMINELNKK